MKCFALLLLSVLPAFGQLTMQHMQPFFRGSSAASFTGCASTSFAVSSATNIIYLDAQCPLSITNLVDGTKLTNWFDLSGTGSNSFSYDTTIFSANVSAPTFGTTSGPGGTKKGVAFMRNASFVTYSRMTNALNTSQPMTIVCVLSDTNINVGHGSAVHTIFDTFSGNRELSQIAPNTTGIFHAGVSVTVPQYTLTNTFIINTIVFDGTSSVWFTNGPSHTRGIFVAGNPSTQGMGGKIILGTDRTGASELVANMPLYLVYIGHMFTNDMSTVEANIQSYLGL